MNQQCRIEMEILLCSNPQNLTLGILTHQVGWQIWFLKGTNYVASKIMKPAICRLYKKILPKRINEVSTLDWSQRQGSQQLREPGINGKWCS